MDGWVDTMTWRARRRISLERGATLVEYAMGVALLCVVSLGAIQFMEDEASDNFNARADRSGAPDINDVADGGTTDGGATTGGSDGTDGGPAPEEVFFDGFSGASSHGNPAKWTAVITVTVVDSNGDAVDGARVIGTWTYGTTTQTVTCNQTSNKGECKFQVSELPPSTDSVTFTLNEISGGVPEVVYNGGPVTSDPILKPTGGGPN
jgi:Flp pilus assembly pilin Flp